MPGNEAVLCVNVMSLSTTLRGARYTALGTLRQQICYPIADAKLSRTRLEELLFMVGLLHLLEDTRAVAQIQNWEDKLSVRDCVLTHEGLA